MLNKLNEKITDYIPNILSALMILIIGYVVIKLLLKLLKTAFSHSKLDETGWTFLLSLTKAVLNVILAVMILAQLKVPMSSIITALGTAGLAIVVALRDSLTNVAGGFIVMFSRPFKVGDYVEIAKKEGTVSQISILYTKLLTLDNKAVIIPNSTVSSATVTNYTQEELRRLELRFRVPLDCDFRLAEEVILATVEAQTLALQKPDKPYIRVNAHNEDSLELLLRVWVRSEDYWELRFGLLADVKVAFDENGIAIPFPQLDVHEK
ncbi:small conductance mechanosensitive channel [Ruminococcus sp. YE71]|uniref:mechanosensitive ion channel family protein n=1 Tax=unclassified Ruminococcus TaxID=2608920 RepID=UPI00088A3F62|nr:MULTISPECIES: mechanosensitive ion channel family protein [unclassified Ruminococcus]SDA23938.1 small conductance mechanosensitive channel [Ruminococcus sp. YE78]SFW40741.1 small conductance mechanosensitive channel [Ruminococcus sp. YE71]